MRPFVKHVNESMKIVYLVISVQTAAACTYMLYSDDKELLKQSN